MPFVGEAADAYKAAKLGVRVADKASDIYKATKTVDRVYDVISKPEVRKALKNAGKIGEALLDGLITAKVYEKEGKQFSAGFVNGFTSSGISSLFDDDYTSQVIGSSIGSAIGTIAEGLATDMPTKELLESAAQSAALGIVSGLSSESVKQFVDMSTYAKSAADILSDYDEKLGKALKFFFDRLFTVLDAIDYEAITNAK